MAHRPQWLELNLFAAVAALCGCAAPGEPLGSSRSAILGGTPDPSDTNVVGIVWQSTNGGIAECSGSLLAPNLVLTAHHCVADVLNKENGPDCATSLFAAPDAASNLFVSTKDLASTSPSEFHTVREIVVPPDSTNTTFCGFDQALLILSNDIEPSEAIPLVPRVDGEIAANDAYAAVGFGSDGAGNFGTRERLDGLLVDCVGPGCASIAAGEMDPQHEWIGDHGPCQGDSGGPALDAANRVIGVVSRGQADCTAPIYGDVYSWSDWIKETARHAAAIAGDTPPPWALGYSQGANVCQRDPVSRTSGCNVSASAPRGLAPWFLGAGIWGLTCRRRRGRPLDRRTSIGALQPARRAVTSVDASIDSVPSFCSPAEDSFGTSSTWRRAHRRILRGGRNALRRRWFVASRVLQELVAKKTPSPMNARADRADRDA